MTKKEILQRINKLNMEVTELSESIEDVKEKLYNNNSTEYSRIAYEQLLAYSNQFERAVVELNELLIELKNVD